MNKKKFLVATCLVVLSGCNTLQSRDSSVTEERASTVKKSETSIVGTPAHGSKFSKIKVGMSAKQVTDIIGMWNDQKTYVTGKAWIPYYYGRDKSRREFYYKNEGRLTIGGNGKLLKITVDTSEDGYQ